MDKKIKNSWQLTQEIEFLQKRIKELERSDAERKKAEQALRESEEKYRHLFENSQAGMYRSRIDGSAILDVNEKWLEIFGYSKEEIVGKPLTIVWAHPEKRKLFIQQLKEKEVVVDYEMYLLTKGGGTRTCLVSASLIPAQEIIEGTIIDITERKAIQERLRTALQDWDRTFNSISDPVLIVDKESIIVKANAAFAESLNIKPEDMLGKKSCEVLHKSNPSWPNCPFEMAKKDKLPHMQKIFDSNIGIPLLVTASPILDDRGEVAGGVLHIKDIVKIKEKIEKFIK